MAANSSNPFHLIAVVNAAAKTFDKEHDVDAEYITKATDNAGDFILWAWGVGAGRVTKTSFSIDQNNTNLELFKTQCHQTHISAANTAWTAVPNGTPIFLRRSSKPCRARTFEHHDLPTSGPTRRPNSGEASQPPDQKGKLIKESRQKLPRVHSQNDPLCLHHGQ
jgi:hypothetical protein